MSNIQEITELKSKILFWKSEIAKHQAAVDQLQASKGTRRKTLEYAKEWVRVDMYQLKACEDALLKISPKSQGAR